jgi:hypothetical protein
MKISGKYEISKGTVKVGFVDDLGRERNAWEAIFPIVQQVTDTKWKPVGTGFFISNNGLFATAKHVLLDGNGNLLRDLYGLHLSANVRRGILREIIKPEVHPTVDVAIGFLFDKPYADGGVQTLTPVLSLTIAAPNEGDRIVSFAYPNSTGELRDNGSEMILNGDAMEGYFEEAHPNGRDRVMLPGACYRTSMPLASGASGGPVVFGNGAVFGINSTGFDGSEVSYISPSSALLELNVRNVRLADGSTYNLLKLTELAKIGLLNVET